MQKYNTEYKDYSDRVAIMVSTDRSIFNEKSAVRARMVGYSKLYKELNIIVFSTKRLEPTEIGSNCNIYSTNSFVRWNYVTDAVKIGKKILKKIDKNQPILITCQDPFETALAGKVLAHLRKDSELIIQIHTDLLSPYFTDTRIGFVYASLNKIRLFISRFTLNQAQVIRVVSEKIADSLVKKGISESKIIVKPIAVNVDYIKQSTPSFSLREKFSQWNKIVVVASRLEAEKNIEMALEAIKIVKDSMPTVGLVIVGSGAKMSELKKLAYKLKIDGNTAFVGWQTDLVPYYKGCDVFLVTSWYEGYGMTFKEAQAAQCKIVSTDVGIAKEVGATIVDWSASGIARGILNVLI